MWPDRVSNPGPLSHESDMWPGLEKYHLTDHLTPILEIGIKCFTEFTCIFKKCSN